MVVSQSGMRWRGSIEKVLDDLFAVRAVPFFLYQYHHLLAV
jgi:hypothetical protein